MPEKLKILLVEDSPSDVKLLQYELNVIGLNYEMKVVDEEETFINALKEYSPDLIISDYHLPTFNGMAALKIALDSYPLIPFIIATGSINEEIAAECIKSGADDYVLKEHIKRIGSAIEGAIRKKTTLKEKLNAVEALKESEQKFRLLAYNSKDFIFHYILLPEPRYEFVSPSSSELIGYSPEEHYKDPFLQRKIIHPEDRQLFDAMIFTNEYYYKPVELRWRHKNGSWVWGEQINVPVYDESNKLIAIEGAAREITARKKTELIIKNKEKELRTLTQNLPDIIARFNKNKEFLFVNESIHELTLIPYHKLVGKSVREIGLPENITALLEEKIDVVFNSSKNTISLFSTKIHSKLNSFEARIIPEFDEDGIVQTALSIIRNVTDERNSHEQIVRANEQFKAVWDNSFEAMRLTDSEGVIVRVNDAFCKMYDKTSEELEGQVFTDFYKCNWDTLAKYKERFVNRNFSPRMEREVELLNGKKIWLHLSNSFVEIKDQPSLLLSIFRDFTKNKIAETEILKAKEKAEEMNKLKSSFLSNMSHELRTPLIGILGFAEVLKNELDNPNLLEYANTIFLSGKRLTETVNSILDFSTLESDKKKMKSTVINIVDVVASIVGNYLQDAIEKNIVLEFKTSAPSISVKLDEKMFLQVISHIINNALKFTNKGSVIVESSTEDIDNIQWAKIEVVDTGIGIPDKIKDQIFEPFRQGSEGLNRTYQGTGLGLSIAKKYTELMKGKISVKSKIGEGSTFTVKFRMDNKPLTTKIPAIVERPKEEILKKSALSEIPDILLVEDDKTNQMAVSYFLADMVQLDITDNGETAIQMAKTVRYSLILMDIGLKGELNGLETVKVIRKIEGYQDIPIVAVSAFAMAGDQERFLSEGCSHYLAKPFLKGDLIRLIQNILNLA